MPELVEVFTMPLCEAKDLPPMDPRLMVNRLGSGEFSHRASELVEPTKIPYFVYLDMRDGTLRCQVGNRTFLVHAAHMLQGINEVMSYELRLERFADQLHKAACTSTPVFLGNKAEKVKHVLGCANDELDIYDESTCGCAALEEKPWRMQCAACGALVEVFHDAMEKSALQAQQATTNVGV